MPDNQVIPDAELKADERVRKHDKRPLHEPRTIVEAEHFLYHAMDHIGQVLPSHRRSEAGNILWHSMWELMKVNAENA